MPNDHFGLDRFSFWLGFLAASLLWFLVYRFRRFWPELRDYILSQIKSLKQRRLAGVESRLLHAVLRRAQAYHFGTSIFSLDQIIVPPHLLAPPPQAPSDELLNARKYYPQVISYLPEAPEFAAHYQAARLTLIQAQQSIPKMAVVGSPGVGKSTALAYLASLIARRDQSSGFLKTYFPIFIHASNVFPHADYEDDPAEALVKAVQFYAPVSALPQSDQFIRNQLDSNTSILLLDGLDELPPVEFEKACIYLAALFGRYPNLRMITTASSDQSSRLLALDIEPMAISGWNGLETREFLRNWCRNWNKQVARRGADRLLPEANELILSGWLADGATFHTPCEWTLLIWAACAGNLDGTNFISALTAHVQRKLSPLDIDALIKAANDILSQQSSVISYPQMETCLSVSPGSQQSEAIIIKLIEEGFLRQHTRDHLSFAGPWLSGYFASLKEAAAPEQSPAGLTWSPIEVKTHCLLSQKTQPWLADFLQMNNPPLFSNLISASRWLRFIPQNHENKLAIMRSLLQRIQSEDLPACIQMALLANMATCNDPTMPVLYKKWLTSKSTRLRQLALLGLGTCQDIKSVANIAACLDDPTPEVRFAACYALSVLDSPEAQTCLVETLQQGDELIKHVVAEALALQGSEGHDIIQQAISSDNLLVRRAAVYGLSLISAPWVSHLLEKIAIEDSQWVVRNAAGQALESMLAPNPYAPKISQPPSETPWLIEFAARIGLGISKQDAPIPIIKQVFRSGSLAEQTYALWMIRKIPNAQLISEAAALMVHPNVDLSETAHYVLWQMQPFR